MPEPTIISNNVCSRVSRKILGVGGRAEEAGGSVGSGGRSVGAMGGDAWTQGALGKSVVRGDYGGGVIRGLWGDPWTMEFEEIRGDCGGDS